MSTKIKVFFKQEATIYVTKKVTATTVTSRVHELSLSDISKAFKEMGHVTKEGREFSFSSYGSTQLCDDASKLQPLVDHYLRDGKTVIFQAMIFRGMINIEPKIKTKAELKAFADMVRSFTLD